MTALVAAGALSACATPAPGDGFPRVADGLRSRTGAEAVKAAPGARQVPAAVNLQDGLSESEAYLLALANNAAFQSALADLGLSQAALVEAGLVADPSLGAVLGGALEATLSIPVDYLWIRPRRLAAANLDQARTAERLVQAGLDLLLETRLRLTDLELAERRLALAQEAGRQSAELARLAGVRVTEGDLTALEARTAEVDAALARELAERATGDVAVARERVRDIAGLEVAQWGGQLQPSPQPLPAVAADALVARALAARPDVRAAELDVQAAGERIGLARAEALRLSLGVKVTEAAAGVTAAGPLPVFNGNRGAVATARARFDKAAYDLAVARARVETEVRESAARLAQAEASRRAFGEVVLPPLRDAQARYERAFAAGDTTLLLVLENSRRLVEARRAEETAAADAHRAAAQLERHVGGSLKAIALWGAAEVRS